MDTCTIPECERPRHCRNWCRMHYERWRTHGDPYINKAITHGMTRHPLYKAWLGMKNRCSNPRNASYERYGAKGIYVCERWRDSFEAFVEDVGARPPGKTLDRIDPQGPYSPENCRWATIRTQRLNSRNVIVVKRSDGVVFPSVREAVRKTPGATDSTLRRRLKKVPCKYAGYGWTVVKGYKFHPEYMKDSNRALEG